MIQRIYIDTSVIGGMYDSEFDVLTKIFFDKAFRAEIVLIVSSLLEEELINAPVKLNPSIGVCPSNNSNS